MKSLLRSLPLLLPLLAVVPPAWSAAVSQPASAQTVAIPSARDLHADGAAAARRGTAPTNDARR